MIFSPGYYIMTLFLWERINVHVTKAVSTSSMTLKENLKYNHPLEKEFIPAPIAATYRISRPFV